MDTHNAKDTYVCTLCDERFTRLDSLERHQENQHGNSKVDCQACGKSVRKDALQQHQQGSQCRHAAELRREAMQMRAVRPTAERRIVPRDTVGA